MPEAKWCPHCQSSKIEIEHIQAFVEVGEYNEATHAFESEWSGIQYTCRTCQTTFIV